MDVNDINIYQGLYGSHEIEFAKGLIHINPFGLIGKKYKNSIEPHAHNRLFQIFLIQKGITHLLFKNKKYVIEKPTIVTIPKNTIHGFEHQTEVGGWIISLSDTVLEHMIYRDASVVDTLECSINRIPYAAAKGGVNALTASLAFEQAKNNIRVVAIATGGTEAPERIIPRNENPMSEQEKIWYQEIVDQTKNSTLQKKYGTIDDQVNAILFLASDEAKYITGVTIPVSGGDLG